MNAHELFPIIFTGSLLAGFLGSLSGLGGGLIIVPLLVIILNVDIHYAIGASLIAVIATSTGASAAYIKEGFTNVRAGIFLETATTVGAISGVAIGSQLSPSILSLTFGLVLFYSAISSFYTKHIVDSKPPVDRLAKFFKLGGSYPSKSGEIAYGVKNVPGGYFVMFLAGALSGILGIGSGALKVIALDNIMGFPFKVSTTTSNFMIGVTAAASAGLYLHLGYISPALCLPVMLGVLSGAILGAKVLPHLHTNHLKRIFGCLVMIIAFQMIYKGLA